MRTPFIAAAFLSTAFLGGCVTFDDMYAETDTKTCASMGVPQRTRDFAQCRLTLLEQHQREWQAAGAAALNYSTAYQLSHPYGTYNVHVY